MYYFTTISQMHKMKLEIIAERENDPREAGGFSTGIVFS